MFRYALLCLAAGLASARVTREPIRPKWSPAYVVEGFIFQPHSELQEPFKAWYDLNQLQSRVDYYDGTVKTYQKPENGVLIKVVPTTTETESNTPLCLAKRTNMLKPQPALPDTKGFKLIGSENLNDAKAWKWQLEVVNMDTRHQFTLWVKYEQDGGSVVSIPLKYEVHWYNTRLGTEYNYYYLDYTHYQVFNEIPDYIFVIHDSCVALNDVFNVNPMSHFISQDSSQQVGEQFEQFKVLHGRQYASDAEHGMRMNIFHRNLRYIESHNRAGRGFTLAVNHLADRTPEELAAMTGLRNNAQTENNGLRFPYSADEVEALSAEVPEEFDWRPHGAVTPVKNQLTCGSCWAFAAVGAVEGALFLHSKQKKLVRLSEQALVDCSWGFSNLGCDGGEETRAYSWIAKHGLPSYEAYGAYLNADGLCHIENVTKTAFVEDWVHVPKDDENALRLAIFKQGPIAVNIYVDIRSFPLYSRGIYYEPACNGVRTANHAVLAVGYGVLDGQSYWLIKNSWGQEWGNGGYILMSTKDNNCGVQSDPTYVVMRN